jgi:ribonuclease BN (tRNA processing enzyme)
MLDGIVISHMHLDHILDLAALRFALSYNPIKPPGRLPLWLPPGGCARFARFALAFVDESEASDFFSSVFDLREYDPGDRLTVGNVLLTFSPTVHYVPCWAMRLRSAGSGDLGYTADTGPAAPLAAFFGDVDVLIAEATLATPNDDSSPERGHLTAEEAGLLADEANAATLVLSHIWEELGLDRLRAEAAATFSGQLVIARPGTVIES